MDPEQNKTVQTSLEISTIIHRNHNSDNTDNTRLDSLESVPLKPKWESVSTEEIKIDDDEVSTIHTTKQTNIITINEEMNPLNHYTKKKWLKLLKNMYCWSRFLILILSLILLCISSSYCVGQLIEVKLDLITECPEPKTREEIWRHSYESSLKHKYNMNGEFILNEESQYGFTEEPCWSIRKIEINTDQIWYTNKYVYQWQSVDYKSILFGFIAFYAFCIIIYNIVTIMIDIIFVAKNKLHTKSVLFKSILKRKEIRNARNWKKVLINIKNKYKKCYSVYSKYLGSDTTGWIIRSLINETMEFVLQSQALLLFNGYHLFDPNNFDNVYLSNKPQYINLFALFISFNCFGSGILWLSYSLCSKRCHGLVFKLSIYFVDQFSDLLYTLFPFIIIFTDDYNQNTKDVLVLLGQLNINSTLAFFASFVPLFVSCNKCLFVLKHAIFEMRNGYYYEWKEVEEMETNNTKSDQSRDCNKKNWVNTDATKIKTAIIKKIWLIVISIIYMVFGICLLVVVTNYLQHTISYCSSITETNYFSNHTLSNITLSTEEKQRLESNPELFYWDKCLYKTYPFGMEDKYKCQCRVFVINWSDLDSTANERKQYFNLTQTKILKGMLESWVMLEKFKTVGNEHDYYVDHALTATMYGAVNMKAFEWKQTQITFIEDGISSWKALEYLKFEHSNQIRVLPDDFNKLTELKYLSFVFSGLGEFSEKICQLTQLIVLEIRMNSIHSIPHCTANLKALKQLLLDVNIQLTDIPFSVFTLPNLIDLSLFQSEISYYSLLDYNLPFNISMNNTIEVNEWFNNNFEWNDLHVTSYWLARNPICRANVVELPYKLQEFMNETNTCYYQCEDNESVDFKWSHSLCIPLLYGDGRCDDECNLGACHFDGGDCTQLCFANPELTNCSWDKYTNDKCDEGCNNKYCTSTEWGSNFKRFLYGPDANQCELDDFITLSLSEECINSKSKYIDYSNEAIYSQCEPIWISDGFCDDACRTDECNQDAQDCELGGCIDDNCSGIYQGFALFLLISDSKSQYTFNYTVACHDWWEEVGNFFNIADYNEESDCHTIAIEADYNNDGMLNFREWVTIGLKLFRIEGDNWDKKATQVNCSSCVGMEYYNA